MVELTRFSDLAAARLFASYLQGHGISAQVERAGDLYLLLLDDPATLVDAQAHLALFVQDPLNPRYNTVAWQTGGLKPPAASTTPSPLFSVQWLGSLGPVVKAVLIACVLIYLSPLLLGEGLYRAMLMPDSLDVLMRQPWRLFTPMFLHFHILHIVFNLLWWMELGRIIERFQSSSQLVLVTLVTAGVSALAQFSVTGPNFGGLSGVVYGLLGYLWLYGKVNPAAGYQLRKEIVWLMLGWLILCYVGFTGVIANEAHLGGLLSGCVLGALTGWWRRRYHIQR